MKTRFLSRAKLAGGLGLLLALALIASLSGPALAIQPQPHQFIGYVRFCDETAGPVVSAGTDVLAKLAGVEGLGWTTKVDDLGRYGVVEAQGGTGTFKIDADDPATGLKEGGVEGVDTVEFWVLGYKVAECPFEVWTLTRLDLVVPEVTLTVESIGCCPIDVTYDGFADQVAPGDSQTFTGIPCCTYVTVSADDSDDLCEFDNWSDGGAQTHDIHMDGNKTVTATCLIKGVTYYLEVTSVGCCPIDVTYDGFADQVAAGDSQTFTGILEGTDVTVYADDTGACCEFDSWSDDGAQTHVITMDGNKNVTAYCSVPTYDLTVESIGCCPIDVTYDGFADQVAPGGSQTFTGIPCCTWVTVSADDSDDLCEFDNWSDGGAQTHDIHMDGNKTVTATCLTEGPPYALTVISDGCCPIDVTYDGFADQVAAGGSQTFTEIPDGTDVTVSADDSGPCCQFDSWSDGEAQTHVITMNSSKSVTATCSTPDILLSIDLVAGWNTFSTPIALAPCADTWGELAALSGIEAEIVYYYDVATQAWGLVEDPLYPVQPLEGFYVKLSSGGTIPIIPNPEATPPPAKELSTGLNLIGPASLVDRDIASSLVDIYEVEGDFTGYSRVLNPPINTPNDWVDNVYIRDDLFVPTMEVGWAYWVIMINPGTLYGFTQTPLIP